MSENHTHNADKPPHSGFSILGISGRPLAGVLLCWFFVIFDGYDLIVYGTVQSHLIEEWQLTDGQAGTIASTAFLGMAVGAVCVGRLSDSLGRKLAIMTSVLVLSVFTTFCALATDPVFFAIFRFCAGVGLGGLVPSANVLTAELVPLRRLSAWSTVMMSGVPLGGSLAAVVAPYVVPTHQEWGWRIMFLFALLPLVIGLPLAAKLLPGREDLARHLDAEGTVETPKFRDLFVREFRTVTFWFTAATFVTLFAWYGLGTWLPRLMQKEGYDFGAALLFTLALNIGAVLGSILTAWAGDRFGPIYAGIYAAFLAGSALLLLLTYPPVWAVFVILVFAGVGTHGTQILVIAAVNQAYPSFIRGTALGWAMGVGRTGAVIAPQLAGLLLGWGLGAQSNFVLFAAGAFVSCISLIIISNIQKQK